MNTKETSKQRARKWIVALASQGSRKRQSGEGADLKKRMVRRKNIEGQFTLVREKKWNSMGREK